MMNKMKFAILGILVIVLGAVASSALFTVHQVEQAIVLQFGKPIRVVKEPGLHVKLPFVQDVRMFENRILNLDPPEFEVLLDDKKRIKVDAFARYKIEDPLKFLQVVFSEETARNRLGNLVNSALRRVIARASLTDLLSSKRGDLMNQIQAEVAQNAVGFGVKIIDIRIGRTDLPTETSQAVFNRMRTERVQEAQELRAQGTEQAQGIRAAADRETVEIRAEAKRKSEQIRGEGDGERNRILAKAYGRDPEFFQFYKSLNEYAKNLVDSDTTMVLSPDSDFFKYFGNFDGSETKQP
jgi:membrane protease subunit HflC